MRRSQSPTLTELIERRVNRRHVMVSGTALMIIGALSGCSRRAAPQTAAAEPGVRQPAAPTFMPIAGARTDDVRVPDGYRAQVIVRWGDALFADTDSLTDAALARGALLEPGAAADQSRQFGYNCDGMGLFETGLGRLVACVNHEFPTPSLMFPGWREALRSGALREYVVRHRESVAVMQAAMGLSVIELDRRDGWRLAVGAAPNRRVTAQTPIEIAGPARGHPLLGDSGVCRGTLGNCAAGVTPWGTYLTAEENIQDYFSGRDFASFSVEAQRVHDRFGMRRRSSAYGWEYVDSRFDLAVSPNEPFRFGWIVELDPLDANAPITKRTALGRCKHEAATTTVTRDGHAAVYMGDDEVFEYFYKFISSARIDPSDRTANRDLLDTGVLHVARLNEDGSGDWLPLVWSESGPLSPRTGFATQADVVLNCRGAADLLGATPLDRPEDIAVDPLSGRVYLSCTQNPLRGDETRPTAPRSGAPNRVDAANPRRANRDGHILEFHEHDDDAGAMQFTWTPLLIAGAPTADSMVFAPSPPLESEQVYYGGLSDSEGLSAFAGPDNLTFDDRGNLWIVTDGIQPDGTNNGCFVCPTTGPARGAVRQFMSGPVDAEICGCEITSDQRSLFLNVQHPGSNGSIEEPTSHWPDGGESVARPSMIAVEPLDPDAKLGD